jgi:hypothetical protein
MEPLCNIHMPIPQIHMSIMRKGHMTIPQIHMSIMRKGHMTIIK